MRTRPKPKKEKEIAPLALYFPGQTGEITLHESQRDCFEYRWSSVLESADREYDTNNSENLSSGQWELFNSWTGETIVEDEHNNPSFLDTVTRAYSFWRDAESSSYQPHQENDLGVLTLQVIYVFIYICIYIYTYIYIYT
jgi:hypothetical protein